MKKRIIIMIIAIMIATVVTIIAGNAQLAVDSNNAIVVTWQTANGNWKSCGPIQRLSLSESSEEIAIDRVSSGPVYFQGYLGEYKIYKTGRDLKKGDFDARRCIK